MSDSDGQDSKKISMMKKKVQSENNSEEDELTANKKEIINNNLKKDDLSNVNPPSKSQDGKILMFDLTKDVPEEKLISQSELKNKNEEKKVSNSSNTDDMIFNNNKHFEAK